MKKVLGLDLGTTSIGWALVNQAESTEEKSSIIKAGVRVTPLSSDEIGQFQKGKAITLNSERTLKRQMRRNLQRYKLRRNNLIEIMKQQGWINKDSILSENGPRSTYQTLYLRARAARERIELDEFARVLLMINKKRGYKSSRKTISGEEGHLINGVEVAKELNEKGITPGQYSLDLIKKNIKLTPDFYKSDLQKEFDIIWKKQAQFYPEILTDGFKNDIEKQGPAGAAKLFKKEYGIDTADNKGKDRRTRSTVWRVNALTQQLEIEKTAYVICDLRRAITNSSGYLGAISDRSKLLYFSRETIGEYLFAKLSDNPHFSTKDIVFYRQDYIDEFETIWETQKKFHAGLTDELKKEIRDIIIFYQRPLKSQKGLISYCEFEKRIEKISPDGSKTIVRKGCRVAPKSSPAFQEFKIWQQLNSLRITTKIDGSERELSQDEKILLADELKIRDKMSSAEILKYLGMKARNFDLNFKEIDGDRTMCAVYRKCLEIIENSGNGEYVLEKMNYENAYTIISELFRGLGLKTDFLSFNTDLKKESYEQQPYFKLWHLLYSYEGDNSKTGDESLAHKISELCGMPEGYARLIGQISFPEGYCSLSHKAIMKILPFLKEGNTYDVACAYAGYNHSHSATAEERDKKGLVECIPQLKKGDLRNPVVEKILNQMVNVVNSLKMEYGRPDEIHIEMARELKQTQAQREKAAASIADNTRARATIAAILSSEFGIQNPSNKDILRYRLYQELKNNGYKTLYSNQYIPKDKVFSKDIDIEHIIPQALLFDDSYSNKTLEFKDINIAKGSETANDFVLSRYGEDRYSEYKLKIQDLYAQGVIGKAKRDKLLMTRKAIPEDFTNRDLSDSQYIARKAKEMLESFVKVVMPTSGSITAELREQWQLVDVMKEINLQKYEKLGKVSTHTDSDGRSIKRIDDWTKRNDHRHHAMDAITIAFTRPAFINALNHLNASKDESSPYFGITRHFTPPMPVKELRNECKKALEDILVSIKAKNKVVTRNVNKTKGPNGTVLKKTELTPRGPLHKEQVYGRRMLPGMKEPVFVIRKEIAPDLNVDKVMDPQIRYILKQRIEEYGDEKKAFSNLETDPIWLNREKGICIKKVTIMENIPGVAIRDKRDKDGKLILDDGGTPIPNDYVNLKNNHHVALFIDQKGNYQEHVVSFFEALERKTAGLPAIDKEYKKDDGWHFIMSMKINEMFVFPNKETGFAPSEIDLEDPENHTAISENLFRVQNLSSKDYLFRHHLETETSNKDLKMKDIIWKRVTSLKELFGVAKVRIDHIGRIVAVGEYD